MAASQRGADGLPFVGVPPTAAATVARGEGTRLEGWRVVAGGHSFAVEGYLALCACRIYRCVFYDSYYLGFCVV